MDAIEDLLYKSVAGYSYCGYNGGHVRCSEVVKLIDKHLTYITDFTKFFNSYGTQFLMRTHGGYGYNQPCHAQFDVKTVSEKLFKLAEFEKIEPNIIKYILKNIPSYSHFVIENLKTVHITKDNINIILSINHKEVYDYIFVEKNSPLYTSNMYETLLFNQDIIMYNQPNTGLQKQNDLITTLEKYIDILINNNISPTKTAIEYAIIKNFGFVDKMFLLGEKLCDDYLIAAFYGRNIKIIEFLLDNKLKPTSNCIMALFQYNEIKLKFNNIIAQNSVMPYSSYDSNSVKQIEKFINILINYNYNFTYPDILLCTQHYITIPSIEKYNIKFDEKFYEICLTSFFPKYEIDITITDETFFERACQKNPSINILRELVEKYKLKPNSQCLINLCQSRANMQSIRYLIEKGAQVTIDVVKTSWSWSSSVINSYLFNEFYAVYKKKEVELNKILFPPIEKKEENNEIEEKPKLKKPAPKESDNDYTKPIELSYDITTEVSLNNKLSKLLSTTVKNVNIIILRQLLYKYFMKHSLIDSSVFIVKLPDEIIKLLDLKYKTINLREIEILCCDIIDKHKIEI